MARESDVGIETGSYDAALHTAGIENYYVVFSTSVLPPETVELAHLPDNLHGSVLDLGRRQASGDPYSRLIGTLNSYDSLVYRRSK